MTCVDQGSLTLLGTKGGPALRKPGASFLPTSNLICFGSRKIIVDCGIGVTQALSHAGHSAASLTDIFITHLHSDHVLELGGLIHTAWTSGLHGQLSVYGPAGTKDIWANFLKMMTVDIETRVVDEGRPHLESLISVVEYNEGCVTQDQGLVVTAKRTIHPPIKESFALCFNVESKKICFSGDTAYMTDFAKFAKGANILVHEAMLESGIAYIIKNTINADDRLYKHLVRSHTFARDVGKIAHDAGVELLVLNHLIPAERNIAKDDDWIAEVRQHFSGNVMVGADGIKIPF
mgnify:CR=1 FL=1